MFPLKRTPSVRRLLSHLSTRKYPMLVFVLVVLVVLPSSVGTSLRRGERVPDYRDMNTMKVTEIPKTCRLVSSHVQNLHSPTVWGPLTLKSVPSVDPYSVHGVRSQQVLHSFGPGVLRETEPVVHFSTTGVRIGSQYFVTSFDPIFSLDPFNIRGKF